MIRKYGMSSVGIPNLNIVFIVSFQGGKDEIISFLNFVSVLLFSLVYKS